MIVTFSRAALVHRRGRRRDQRARQPGGAATAILRAAIDAGARLAEPGEFTLRAFLQRQARSGAGRSRRGSDRRGHAAPGARGVRSTRGHADGAIREIESRAVRSDGAARGVAGFSRTRAITSSSAAAVRRVDRARARRASATLLRERGARAPDPRRRAGRDRRHAERRQVEPVQRAAQRQSRDRDADSGDDARSADRARGHPRPVDRARRHGRHSRDGRCRRTGRRRARAPRGGDRRSDCWSCSIDRARSTPRTTRCWRRDARSRRAVCRRSTRSDLPAAWHGERTSTAMAARCEVSALTGAGLDALAERIAATLGAGRERRDQPLVTNVRHIALLERARDALTRAVDAVRASNGHDPRRVPARGSAGAAAHLQEITGKRHHGRSAAHIFERFCIGK